MAAPVCMIHAPGPAPLGLSVGLICMPRATITITTDDPAEVEAIEAWFEQWRPSLARVSDNYGCGCCVDIYDVEGPSEAIDSIPESCRTMSDWQKEGTSFGSGCERPPHAEASRPWWRFW
jgi:hypothetical protein